jgi:integrase
LIIGALDSGCRCGEMMKIQNKQVDWQHRWIGILKENSKTVNLHWHDLRHEALSRLADDGVPVHELQMLAGHANITTTQRYMNARANSLAESMRQARERRTSRIASTDEEHVQVG